MAAFQSWLVLRTLILPPIPSSNMTVRLCTTLAQREGHTWPVRGPGSRPELKSQSPSFWSAEALSGPIDGSGLGGSGPARTGDGAAGRWGGGGRRGSRLRHGAPGCASCGEAAGRRAGCRGTAAEATAERGPGTARAFPAATSGRGTWGGEWEVGRRSPRLGPSASPLRALDQFLFFACLKL